MDFNFEYCIILKRMSNHELNKIAKALRQIKSSESFFSFFIFMHLFLVELFYLEIHVISPSQNGQSVE